MAWNEVVEIKADKIPYEFHLHGFCDLQLGSESTSLSAIKTRIKEITDDPCDSGVIIPGDIEDEDRPSTRELRKRAFADRGEVPYRDAQKHMAWIDKEVIPLLLPLQKTKFGIVGVIAGHHWTQLSPVLNSAQYICQELTRLSGKKVPYMGEMMSYLELRFRHKHKSRLLKGLVMHGEGGGQTKASTINKIERAAQGFDGDFFIRAHDCQLVATKTDKLYPKYHKNPKLAPEMLSRTITYLNLGAATQGYNMSRGKPSYIEQAMLRPSTMGWGTINFKLRSGHPWEDLDRSLMVEMKVTI